MRPTRLLAALTLLLTCVVAYAATPTSAAPAPVTRLVLKVTGCEGCTFGPNSSVGDGDVWEGKPKKVRNGKVTFKVPTDRTAGLRLVLEAPFEGNTGGVPHVVFAYKGLDEGDAVTLAQAEAATKGSVCFAGTTAKSLKLKITVDRAMVTGLTSDGSLVVGARAYAAVTQPVLKPYETVRSGYFSAQAVPLCRG